MNYLLVEIISWLIFLFGLGAPLYMILSAIGISGFKEITSYEPHNSLFYRMNPLVKIFLSLAVMIAAAITIWWIGALLTVTILLSYSTLKNGRKKLFIGGLFVLSTIIGTSWGYAPFVPNSILSIAFSGQPLQAIWTWPGYFSVMGYQHTLTLQALEYGFQIALRSAAIISSALLLVMTNTPTQILRTLHKFSVPDVIIFSLMVGMKSIPSIFGYLDESIKVQMMRGLGSKRSPLFKPFYMLMAGIYAIVPTLIHILRGAKDIAISADTRGFRASKKRSYVEDIPFAKIDYYAFGAIISIVLFALLAIVLGFGRTIPYVT